MVRWLLLIGLAGCSLTLTGPDPNRPRLKPPTCDTGKGLVALDGVLAGASAIGGLAAAANNDGGAAVLPFLLGSALVASAIHGNTLVNDCRKETDDYTAMAQRSPRATEPRPSISADEEPRPAAPPTPTPAVAVTPPVPLAPPPAPPPPAKDDPWKEFWREVP